MCIDSVAGCSLLSDLGSCGFASYDCARVHCERNDSVWVQTRIIGAGTSCR